ncbi:MAG: hypothetical protein SGCHY_003548 [Lobulomycetales sp.]
MTGNIQVLLMEKKCVNSNSMGWQNRPKSADASGAASASVVVQGIQGLAPETVISQLVKKSLSFHQCAISVSSHRLTSGNSMIVTVPTQIQADVLRRLSGIRIGSANKLLVSPMSGNDTHPSKNGVNGQNASVEAISQLLQSRYNPQSLAAISTLPKAVPNLVNLSLKDNQIEKWSEISCLRGSGFSQLRELLFVGNPICPGDNSTTGSVENYQRFDVGLN